MDTSPRVTAGPREAAPDLNLRESAGPGTLPLQSSYVGNVRGSRAVRCSLLTWAARSQMEPSAHASNNPVADSRSQTWRFLHQCHDQLDMQLSLAYRLSLRRLPRLPCVP